MRGNRLASALAAVLLMAGPASARTDAATGAEQDIAAGSTGALKGTLAGAGAGRPVVLILPGSGPTDRDGDSPLGIRAAPYRLLAQGLAARGIASVRIDKRGLFASAGATASADAVTIDDYVGDTTVWIEAIRARTGACCVWLLGHSEGGLIALAAAARTPGGICGLVLVATAGRPLGAVLRDQLHANPVNASLLPAADAAIDRLAAGGRVDPATLPAPLAPLFRPSVQGLLASEFALDPARLLGGTTLPVLIVQGGRDLQVSVADARALAAADPKARLVLLPDVNHVLKQVASDERPANLATYADPFLPLAPGVVEAVAGFVGGKPAR